VTGDKRYILLVCALSDTTDDNQYILEDLCDRQDKNGLGVCIQYVVCYTRFDPYVDTAR